MLRFLAAPVLVALMMSAPARAQYVSDSDYVRLDSVSILVPRATDTAFSLLVRLETKTPALVITIPLSYAGNPNLEIDTTVVDLSGNQGVTQDSLGLFSSWWLTSSAIDTVNRVIMLGWASFSTPLPPSTGPLVRVHFRLKPTAVSDTILIDSTFFPPGNQVTITDPTAIEWTPQFVPGMIGLPLEGPGATDLNVDPPQDQQHIVNLTPQISWGYVNSRGLPQTRYEVQCGTDADWSVAEKWQSGQVFSASPFATYAGSALADGSTYYYRVRVYDDSTWSPWSSGQFRMNSPPTGSTPTAPAGDTLVLTLTPTLTSAPATDAEGDLLTYDYQVYQDAALTTLVASVTGRSAPTWIASTLPDNARYWWRVRAHDGYEAGAWSAAATFWVDGVPQPPVPAALATPANAVTIERDTIRFVWRTTTDPDPFDTLSYRVEWSTSSGFTAPRSIGWIADTSAIPTDTFITSQLYYWRVITRDKRAMTSTSAVRTFTTEAFAGPFVLALAADYPQSQQHIVNHAPTLAWDYAHNKGLPQTKYQLEVGTDANWTVAEMWTPGQVASPDSFVVYAGNTLVDGATYYARARVFDGSHWSLWTQSSFHMNSRPTTPTTVSPSGSQLVASLTPTLTAGAASDPEGDSLGYDFQVYSDIALTTLAASISGAPGPSAVSPSLPDNKQYWWRARAGDGYESGNWSSAASFWVDGVAQLPSAPALMSPQNAGTIDRDTAFFIWHRAQDPDPFDTLRYRLQYATNPGFSSAVTLGRQGDTVAIPGESLLVSQTYYWRVFCIDKNSGDSSVSSAFSFTTESFAGPFVTTVTVGAPQDPQHIVVANPVIAWTYSHNKGSAQTKYEIECGTDADWTVAEMWKPGVLISASSSATYGGAPLQDGSTYYCRVRAYGGGHWSLWSQTSFRMNSPPAVPLALSPVGDALELTLTPMLAASTATDPQGDPLTYEFRVFQDPGLTSLVASVAGRTTPNWTTTALPDNAHVWWQVRAADAFEPGAWGSAASFWVDGVPQPPAAPLLVSPANSANVPRLGAQFIWRKAADPDPFDTLRYRLEWSTSPAFTPTQSLPGLLDTSVVLPDSLDGGQTYYWRVRCFDQRSGDSSVSAVRSVSTPATPFPYAQSLRVDAPQDQLHITSANPVIAWHYSHDIGLPQVKYEAECGTDADWSVAEMWVPGEVAGSDTSVVYGGSALADGVVYYVRVRVSDGVIWSDWAQSSFRMNTPPPSPTPISPSGDALVFTSTPTMAASAVTDAQGDAVIYSFAAYSDSALTAVIASAAGRLVPSWTTAILPDNSRVWWRCRAFDGYEFGSWGAVASYWVDGVPELPGAPQLISPANGSVVSEAAPSFRWRRSVDPDPFDTVSYRVQYAIDAGFAGSVTLAPQTDTSAVPLDTLQAGVTYYWRVFGYDLRSADSVVSSTFSLSRGAGGTPGDVTGEGLVTASDIIYLVNYVFKGGAAPALLWTADVNADCSVTASDIISLVNFVFKGGAAPKVGCA